MSERETKTSEWLDKELGLDKKTPFKRMLNGHLAVEIDDFRYSGKIVIPENAKRKPTKGRVVAVADDITDIKLGDKVLFSQFAGYLLVFDGMPKMRAIGYAEVLAVLNEDAPEVLSEGA